MPKTNKIKSTSIQRTKPYSGRGRRRKSYVMADPDMESISEIENVQPLQNIQNNELNKDDITSNPSLTEMNALLHTILKNQCTKDDFKDFSINVNHRLGCIEERLEGNDDKMMNMVKRMVDCEESTASIKYQMEFDRQRQLKENITVHGIPSTNNENLNELISKLLSKIDCEASASKIATSYRIRGNNINIIVVKLADFETKQLILSTKQKHKLSLGDVMSNSKEPKTPLYINNHTTPFFGKLLAEGRKMIKTGKIHSCWLNNFGCQLKFTENGKNFNYKSLADLNKLIDGEGSKTSKRRASLDEREGSSNPKAKK